MSADRVAALVWRILQLASASVALALVFVCWLLRTTSSAAAALAHAAPSSFASHGPVTSTRGASDVCARAGLRLLDKQQRKSLPKLQYHSEDTEVFDDSIWDAGLKAAEGNQSVLLSTVLRAYTSNTFRIQVWGGSMTLGVGCCKKGCIAQELNSCHDKDEAETKNCAWSARFGSRIRQASPHTNVTIDNRAIRACGARCALPRLALHYSLYDAGPFPDIVFFDFSINDKDHSYRQDDVYEQLIRIVHFYSPSTLIAVLWSTRIGERWQRGVADHDPGPAQVALHYAVPFISIRSAEDALLSSGSNRSHCDIWDGTVSHPSWLTHVYIADLLVRWWNSAAQKLQECDLEATATLAPNGPAALQQAAHDFSSDESWVPPLNKNNLLARTAACLSHISKHSAYEPGPSSPRGSPDGSWRLYEDRPNKPGWIAKAPSDWITFPVKFGMSSTLIVQYLKSYESLGDAEVKIWGRSIDSSTGQFEEYNRDRDLGLLRGSWEDRTSQIATEVWKSCNITDDACMDDDKWHSLYFPQLPVGPANISFRLAAGQKFKLISVISC